MTIATLGRSAALALVPLALAACTSLPGAKSTELVDIQPETFDSSAHSRHFAVSPALACEAARRALLSQGYVVTATKPEQVSGRKYFQPAPEHHVQLEFRVVCAPEQGDSERTVAFVSGLKEQYVVRKVKESASLGVGGFGSLSLPVEGGLDSLVKVASTTVTDAKLYQRFFDRLDGYLSNAVPPEEPDPGED
ncbi:DUF2242 domain-containing protein [Ottowia flava]|uniref:DUF2242 domain-containing protein n=1 Tax=Ottowia flava TaxID=2675430 RepID=A0ABW4KU99_9BURK|nr:DUF2242 domain-containing protein [Ottowia sp. GY511]